MTAPWTAPEADPDRVAADLARWFPGTVAWLGGFTRNWWALVRDSAGGYHLVEALTPAGLVRRLDALGVRRAEPAPTDSHAPLVAPPEVTVPDLPRIASAAAVRARPAHRRHPVPRRGWLTGHWAAYRLGR